MLIFMICNSTNATNVPLTLMIPDVSHGGENEFAVVLIAGTRSPAAAMCWGDIKWN